MLVRNLPRTSATARAQHGDAMRWGETEHLLAGIYDLLAGANWQRTRKSGGRPKPLKRPGAAGSKTYGKPMRLAKAKELLRRWRHGDVG